MSKLDKLHAKAKKALEAYKEGLVKSIKRYPGRFACLCSADTAQTYLERARVKSAVRKKLKCKKPRTGVVGARKGLQIEDG